MKYFNYGFKSAGNDREFSIVIQWFIGLAFALAILVFICGCSTVKQVGHSITYDPKTGIVATNSLEMTIFTWGNAKTAVESQKGTVGKTISIGTTGIDQQTDMASTIKAIGDAASQVFSAGAAAGAAAISKSIAP